MISATDVVGRQYAVKLEKATCVRPLLLREGDLLKVLQGASVPRYVWHGTLGSHNVLVMQQMPHSLQSLIHNTNGLDIRTTCFLAGHLILALESMHERGYLHRDLKPANILVGPDSSNNFVPFIVDFGLAKAWRSCYGQHIPYRMGKAFVGNARYGAIAAHRGMEMGRKDELESLLYVIIYCHKKRLPWQGVRATDRHVKYARIGELKSMTSIESLCQTLPAIFVLALNHVRRLHFTETPDYAGLAKMFIDYGTPLPVVAGMPAPLSAMVVGVDQYNVLKAKANFGLLRMENPQNRDRDAEAEARRRAEAQKAIQQMMREKKLLQQVKRRKTIETCEAELLEIEKFARSRKEECDSSKLLEKTECVEEDALPGEKRRRSENVDIECSSKKQRPGEKDTRLLDALRRLEQGKTTKLKLSMWMELKRARVAVTLMKVLNPDLDEEAAAKARLGMTYVDEKTGQHRKNEETFDVDVSSRIVKEFEKNPFLLTSKGGRDKAGVFFSKLVRYGRQLSCQCGIIGGNDTGKLCLMHVAERLSRIFFTGKEAVLGRGFPVVNAFLDFALWKTTGLDCGQEQKEMIASALSPTKEECKRLLATTRSKEFRGILRTLYPAGVPEPKTVKKLSLFSASEHWRSSLLGTWDSCLAKGVLNALDEAPLSVSEGQGRLVAKIYVRMLVKWWEGQPCRCTGEVSNPNMVACQRCVSSALYIVLNRGSPCSDGAADQILGLKDLMEPVGCRHHTTTTTQSSAARALLRSLPCFKELKAVVVQSQAKVAVDVLEFIFPAEAAIEAHSMNPSSTEANMMWRVCKNEASTAWDYTAVMMILQRLKARPVEITAKEGKAFAGFYAKSCRDWYMARRSSCVCPGVCRACTASKLYELLRSGASVTKRADEFRALRDRFISVLKRNVPPEREGDTANGISAEQLQEKSGEMKQSACDASWSLHGGVIVDGSARPSKAVDVFDAVCREALSVLSMIIDREERPRVVVEVDVMREWESLEKQYDCQGWNPKLAYGLYDALCDNPLWLLLSPGIFLARLFVRQMAHRHKFDSCRCKDNDGSCKSCLSSKILRIMEDSVLNLGTSPSPFACVLPSQSTKAANASPSSVAVELGVERGSVGFTPVPTAVLSAEDPRAIVEGVGHGGRDVFASVVSRGSPTLGSRFTAEAVPSTLAAEKTEGEAKADSQMKLPASRLRTYTVLRRFV